MSKYVVFKCRSCGKAGLSELRTKTLDKPAKILEKKKLTCKYCNKSSTFGKTFIIDVHNKPMEAMHRAKRINLEGVESLPLEEKMIIAKIGENYVKDETTKHYE